MNGNYPTKTYLHFDKKTNFNKKVENYVNDFEKNPRHSFLPLIFDEKVNERYIGLDGDLEKNFVRQGKTTPIRIKKRKIMYASHIDNFIYKHYGLKLNELYNNYLQNNKFESVSTAYRQNSEYFTGKCNIHFSAEIINFISNNPDCIIYVGDFSDFFDKLNHEYLKLMICKLYDDTKIPTHQFKIFKSLTNFSYINKQDIEKHFGQDSEFYQSKKIQYVDSFLEFRQFKNQPSIVDGVEGKVLRTNEEPYGIPQGTAISSIYSNIYMLDIDKIIHEKMTEKNGIYRRYSDDYIMVIPNQTNGDFEQFKNQLDSIMRNTAHLTIHDDKTQIMRLKQSRLVDFYDNDKEVKLDYLGFTFDGKNVSMREKSVHKYYRSAHKLIKKGYMVSKSKGHSRLTFKRKIYQRYHIFGERTDIKYSYPKRKYGTFITYAFKSKRIFDEISPSTNNLMVKQIKNHQKNINSKIQFFMGKLLENETND